MDIKTWLLYFITSTILAFIPGPAVLFVSAKGLKYGTRSGSYAAMGISFGNFIYFILSALGLGAFIVSAGNLFAYIKIAGAIYLVYSGSMIIYSSFKKSTEKQAEIRPGQTGFKSFIQACLTQLANPKAILFFVALLPQFINPHRNVPLQLLLLAITTIIPETFILILYAWLASKSKTIAGKNEVFRKWQDRAAGSILVGLGINLFFLKDVK